jgi:hypothetical protein
MSSTAVLQSTYSGSDVRACVVPGLGAGAAFLGFEMVVGAFTTTAWSFPQAIPQVIGLVPPTSEFEPISTLLGVVIHLAFSIGLGVLFAAIARQLGLRGGKLVAAAVLFMWAESAISIWAVLHTLFPATLPFLFGAVPFWASFVGRTGFGLVLAALYARR